MVSSKALSDVFHSNIFTIGTSQRAPHDFIDQVFGDLGYGYEELPFPDEDHNQEQNPEENEEDEEEPYNSQGNAQFFDHLRGNQEDEGVYTENPHEDSEEFNDTLAQGKRKQVGKRVSDRRVKARINEEVSFFLFPSTFCTYICKDCRRSTPEECADNP